MSALNVENQFFISLWSFSFRLDENWANCKKMKNEMKSLRKNLKYKSKLFLRVLKMKKTRETDFSSNKNAFHWMNILR